MVTNLKVLGANLLILSITLQVGALQWHFLESYFTEMASPIQQLRGVQKTFLKYQVIHVLKCPVCPLQGANEMRLTWSVKMHLLLVLLMIYEALSQGNAVNCREELMRHCRGIVWRSLAQLPPTLAVAILPAAAPWDSVENGLARAVMQGFKPTSECCSIMIMAHGWERWGQMVELQTWTYSPLALLIQLLRHFSAPADARNMLIFSLALLSCSCSPSSPGPRAPVDASNPQCLGQSRCPGRAGCRDEAKIRTASGINLNQNKLSLTYCEYRGKNISYSDQVWLMSLIQYPPLRYFRGLKLTFVIKEQSFSHGPMPLYVFKISAFLSKGLVKKIHNIWLIEQLSFRTEIVPFQNIALITGI